MRSMSSVAILLFAAMVWIGVGIWFLADTRPKKGSVIVIDCTLAEISPDFSTEMRELCRKSRMKQTTQ